MKHIKSIEEFNKDRGSAVTIGKFDGMHLGHHALIKDIAKKEEDGLCSVVVSFDISPRIALKKTKEEAKFLFTNNERSLIIREHGVDVFLEMEFTDSMIKTEPEDFIKLLLEKLNMKYLCVGSDFRFGYKGRGDALLLKRLSKEYGFVVNVIDKVLDESKIEISSTLIREDITKGNLKRANDRLGYEFFLIGDITHGNRIGTKLGMPTINLRPQSSKLLVPNGVYVSKTTIGDKSFYGVTNVGMRPTINESKKEVLVETHLLDFNDDVYGDSAKVSFMKYLREEKKFDSLDRLKEQISKDIKLAKEFVL